jgi:protein SCO1/2
LIHIKVRDDFSDIFLRMKTTSLVRLSSGSWIAVIALSSAALLSSACGKKSEPGGNAPDRYEVRGLVRGLPPDHKTVDIEHEDIPGFMPSMTMPFEIREDKAIDGLNLGDAIAFRLNVTRRESWIDHVRKIDAAELHLAVPATTPAPVETVASERLHEGDQMPDFQLTDQEGKLVTLETFRGHPLVLTFIFTRCPLPNFCPRMSQDFGDLQKAIQAASSGPLAATRLLSLSFDPEHDTPEVLKEYGHHAGADFAIWTFATGSSAEVHRLTKRFSVLVQPEKGTISHSLTTALVDPDGRIRKIWRGNGWTPAEVVSELR